MIFITLQLLFSVSYSIVDLSGEYVEYYRLQQGSKYEVGLQYTNPEEYYIKSTSPVHEYIKIQVNEDSNNEVTLKILNNSDEFEIPHEFPFPYNKDHQTQNKQYQYSVFENGSLFKLQRNDGKIIFNLKEAKVLSKLYAELRATLETDWTWGWGERRLHTFQLPHGQFTIWNHDYWEFEANIPGGQQYGSHPVMLQKIDDLYHIIFVRVSRPLTAEITDSELIYRITGGQLEFKFFIGDKSAKDVINKYHRYINGWSLHPFWSSGWHQCRWGYQSSEVLKELVQNYTDNNLPLEAFWTDLDYMQEKKDYTLNEELFPREDIQWLSDRSRPEGLHWVPIVDPGIAVDSDCGRDLVESKAYIRSNRQDETPLLAEVWPGDVYFGDFNHYNASEMWHQCQIKWQKKYDLFPSGMWIDMNELANFVDGEKADGPPLNKDFITLQDLPWDAMGDALNLESAAISIDGYHEGNGKYFKGLDYIQELDFHNFNGFLQAIATKDSQERIHGTSITFILTRSQTYGSGRFVIHWFGDNASTWEWLRSSIASIFMYNLFGMPFTGDDICGFNGNATAQLCARWIQVGVLYPFARSHNMFGQTPQEPYAFGGYVTESAKKSLTLRYSLLKYYYTLFILQRDQELQAGVGTIVDPLFYYYDDENVMNIDTQFMIGKHLIVIPILNEQVNEDLGYTEREYYVPKQAQWYDYESGKKLPIGTNILRRNFNDTAFLALNAGSVIPISDSNRVMRLRFLPNEIDLIVVLDSEGKANGEYLSIASYEELNVEKRCWASGTSCVRNVNVTLKKGVLVFTNEGMENDKSEEIFIQNIILYYLNSIKIINVNVSSLTRQWQINL